MPENFKTVTFKGSQIAYTISGNGPAVILLHGFAQDGSIWEDIAIMLQKNYTVIIPDIPGSGKSELLQWNAGIDDYADAVHEILIHENISKVIFIGHSMGGYTGLAFAEKYADKLSGLGLIHSTAFADDEQMIKSRHRAIQFMQTKGCGIFLKQLIKSLFWDKEKNKPEIETLQERGKDFTIASLKQYYEAMMNRPDRTLVLKNAAIPVLLILGKHDTSFTIEDGLQQTHIASCSFVHVLQDTGHMGMLEEKENTVDILINFLHYCKCN